ncbi:hypothetical protein FFK22_015125 [Mycobacterium sp. KBS0706]|uniref:hypothetical protein n=1 Tax=Mycobacterium sp. KBS0706 TaxID=2578109 RepID=UPI00117DD85A|nr:hypothetical protein [Mycobacterium sp. KBS0706]TSD87796.1 hypothetical protein FFK22_015125 [Mycobacterium sp. KBS0706]
MVQRAGQSGPDPCGRPAGREPVLSRYPDFAAILAAGEDDAASTRLRRAEQIGRPLGGRDFLDRLERESGRPLAPARRGRKLAKSALSPQFRHEKFK